MRAGLGMVVGLAGVAWGEVVFDNIPSRTEERDATFAAMDSGGKGTEFGDEIVLAGEGRIVTEFRFEYVGRFVANGDERARVRFYANTGHGPYLKPSLMLFDSGWFLIPKDLNRVSITPNAVVEVPNSLTWTVEFSGVTQTPGDIAELVVHDPPMVGRALPGGKTGSYDDCWKRDGDAWKTATASQPLNFAARLTAVNEIVTPTVVYSEDLAEARIEWSGRARTLYRVEGSDDLKTWTVLETVRTGPDGVGEFMHAPAPALPFSNYRVVRLPTPPARGRLAVIPRGHSEQRRLQCSGDPGVIYQVYGTEDLVEWDYLDTVQAGQSGVVEWEDAGSARNKRRFYSVWSPW